MQVCDNLAESLAWWGFATISDKQRFESLIRRAIQLGLYANGGPAVADLVANLDDTLFASVLANDSHVLHNLLPDRNDCSYSLRPRCHARALSPLGVTTETFLINICLKICKNLLICNYVTTNCVSCVLSAAVLKH